MNASAFRTSVLLTIVMCSRNGSIGARLLGDRSNSRPAFSGAHMNFLAPKAVLPAAPCTISTAARRMRLGAAFARAVRAGTIASRNGSAIVTPMPLSIVRREMCFFVMIIASPDYPSPSAFCLPPFAFCLRLTARPCPASAFFGAGASGAAMRNAWLLAMPCTKADIR